MIRIKDDVRIIAVDDNYSERGKDYYSIYFNSMNTIISPKEFLCVFALFNGLLEKEKILNHISALVGNEEGNRCFHEINNWGILEESTESIYNTRMDKEAFENALLEKRVVFDCVPSVAIDTAILLHLFGIDDISFQCEDRIIDVSDYSSSIFVKDNDIGKSLKSFFKSKGLRTLFDMDEECLNSEDIALVSFHKKDVFNESDSLVILASDYKDIKNFGFNAFRQDINLSEGARASVEEFIWAFHICEDLFFSIGNGTYD